MKSQNFKMFVYEKVTFEIDNKNCPINKLTVPELILTNVKILTDYSNHMWTTMKNQYNAIPKVLKFEPSIQNMHNACSILQTPY